MGTITTLRQRNEKIERLTQILRSVLREKNPEEKLRQQRAAEDLFRRAALLHPTADAWTQTRFVELSTWLTELHAQIALDAHADEGLRQWARELAVFGAAMMLIAGVREVNHTRLGSEDALFAELLEAFRRGDEADRAEFARLLDRESPGWLEAAAGGNHG